jgi:signal transduction histidine kinase
MTSISELPMKFFERVLPWVVLAIVLTYSYAKFFAHPYGIWWTADGTVDSVFVNEREPTIHRGDKLLQVGSLSFEAFRADLRQELFGSLKAGQSIAVVVDRHDQIISVPWRLPGTNAAEMQDQLYSEWFLAYFFWVAGMLTLLVLRPRDSRWSLLSVFDFLTSIWLISGSGLSSFHIWYSALVLRTAIWISLPVYLHLHWVFPQPLGKLPGAVLWGGYAAAGALAIAQWFQLLPPNLFYAAFLLAIVGSLALLITHFLRQPRLRRDSGMVLIAGFLAIIPAIAVGVSGLIQGSTPRISSLALLSFPILPFAYLYAAYRRQLGDLEIRVNRLLSIYAFLILLGTVIVPSLVLINRLPVYSADQHLITGVIASIMGTALSLWGFPIFQRYMERRWLGIALPSKELQRTYSSRITSSNSFASLKRLLNEEILPSLLVRQFVCLVHDHGSVRIVLRSGVTEEQIPTKPLLVLLRPMTKGHPGQRMFEDPRYAWVRQVLPLRAQDDVLGFWLFGQRDPDDVYSTVEIPMLQSLADQCAIALSNIMQTERLRSMYQADINRYEQERLSLARNLHDSVLSELAGMLMNADLNSLPKSFQEGYQALTQRLREIVSDLRPPMLNYGLKPAIEELADSLMERSNDAVSITVEIESSDDRYPLETEQHLFRIVQEACENAVRHSHGKKVTVSGLLEADRVELSVVDDGDGFYIGNENFVLDDLLREKHFGQAGMLERAELIHAEIGLISAPGKGTRVNIRWASNRTAPNDDHTSRGFSS